MGRDCCPFPTCWPSSGWGAVGGWGEGWWDARWAVRGVCMPAPAVLRCAPGCTVQTYRKPTNGWPPALSPSPYTLISNVLTTLLQPHHPPTLAQAYRNTVAVPRHWSQKRKYLQVRPSHFVSSKKCWHDLAVVDVRTQAKKSGGTSARNKQQEGRQETKSVHRCLCAPCRLTRA